MTVPVASIEAIMGALKALRGEAGVNMKHPGTGRFHQGSHDVTTFPKGNGTKTHTNTETHGNSMGFFGGKPLEMPFCRGHDQLPLFSHKVEGVMTSKRSKQSALSFLQSLGKAFWLVFLRCRRC